MSGFAGQSGRGACIPFMSPSDPSEREPVRLPLIDLQIFFTFPDQTLERPLSLGVGELSLNVLDVGTGEEARPSSPAN